MTTKRLLALITTAAIGLTACGGSGAQAPASPSEAAAGNSNNNADEPAAVTVKNIAFKPPTMKVLRGTEVTWTNEDAGVRHTATSGQPGKRAVSGVTKGSKAKADGTFDGDMPDAGDTFKFTFNEAGTFKYFCEIHPSMRASIVVE